MLHIYKLQISILMRYLTVMLNYALTKKVIDTYIYIAAF